MIECGRCDAELDSNDVEMDDEVECENCGAMNVITVDTEGDDDGNGIGDAYVSSWICSHGISGDENCDDCEAEDALNIR